LTNERSVKIGDRETNVEDGFCESSKGGLIWLLPKVVRTCGRIAVLGACVANNRQSDRCAIEWLFAVDEDLSCDRLVGWQ